MPNSRSGVRGAPFDHLEIQVPLDRVASLPEYVFATQLDQLTATRSLSSPGVESGAAVTGGRKHWRVRTSPFAGRLAHIGLPELVARVLEVRGIGTKRDAEAFLGGREEPRVDPFLIPGFEMAVRRLRRAVQDCEAVAVYGDFDVDGITATATLTETLNDLGAHARPYIPHREREGYGLNRIAIDVLARDGIRVLVTCDCGTSSVSEVQRARDLGLDVIVVDHHLPPAVLPEATALLNPKLRGSEYGFPEYCSAGLAFRLAGALYEACGRSFPEGRYLDLATLGTIADVVPLLGENRDLVRRGLAAVGDSSRPGLQALMAVAGVKPKQVSAESVAFALAPRLNAAGRLADARLALDLLMAADETTAMTLAEQIDGLNRERQRLTREGQAAAEAMFSEKADLPIAVVGHADFNKGIVGLIASRLVEVFGRPAAVYQIGTEESRGSCRSIAPYDIVAGLESCGDIFERYGGHHQAAGFTISNRNLDALEERLAKHAGQALAGYDLAPSLEIDAEWPLASLRAQEIRFLGKLAPHGAGNPEVTLLSRGVTVVESRNLGDSNQHLRLRLKAGNVTWSAIAFNQPCEAPTAGARVDVVYSLSADRYGPAFEGNGGALQLLVQDFVASA
jgi:single-stranded-DNA-specific exonuclease